jgi:hypothetical protein
MVKFPATRRVPFHQLVNVLLIVFKLSASLAKHLLCSENLMASQSDADAQDREDGRHETAAIGRCLNAGAG